MLKKEKEEEEKIQRKQKQKEEYRQKRKATKQALAELKKRRKWKKQIETTDILDIENNPFLDSHIKQSIAQKKEHDPVQKRQYTSPLKHTIPQKQTRKIIRLTSPTKNDNNKKKRKISEIKSPSPCRKKITKLTKQLTDTPPTNRQRNPKVTNINQIILSPQNETPQEYTLDF
jgi:hypothetical protein